MKTQYSINDLHQSGLTLKELTEKTGAPYYTVQYLSRLGRLPVVRESSGPGYPILYSPEAVDIIRKHLEKSNSRFSVQPSI